MNVVVEIQGRAAIPVRAIPLLTDWHFWSPDVVASVLEGNAGGTIFVFGELEAHRLEHGAVQAAPKRWWGFAVQHLLALSEEIKATQVGDEAGYRRWRSESLSELPASVFVWKAEFETFHRENWQRRARMFQVSLPGEDEDDQEGSPDSTEVRAFPREAIRNLNLWRELDFAPLIQPEHRAQVMEGFGQPVAVSSPLPADTPHVTAPADTKPPAVPVADAPASEPRMTATGPRFNMTKAAMIEQHKHEWPTIERDISDAKRNKLSAAAKEGARGWREADAMEWARNNRKLPRTQTPVNSLAGAVHKMSSLPASRHTLEG